MATRRLRVRPVTRIEKDANNADVQVVDLFAGVDDIRIIRRPDELGDQAPQLLDANGKPREGWGLFVRWAAVHEGTNRADAIEHFRLYEAMPSAVFNAGTATTDAERTIRRVEKMVTWLRLDALVD